MNAPIARVRSQFFMVLGLTLGIASGSVFEARAQFEAHVQAEGDESPGTENLTSEISADEISLNEVSTASTEVSTAASNTEGEEIPLPQEPVSSGTVEGELEVVDLPPVVTETVVVETISQELGTEADDQPKIQFGDWPGYNTTRTNTTWLAGSEFGLFSLESFPTLPLGEDSAIVGGTGFHFLDGPSTPDLAPRLFDLQTGYHARKAISPNTVLDIKLGVGVFTDFETSVRKGIRFPSHAVTYYNWHPQFISVLGVDVLDRDDISLLPVAGFVWHPAEDLVLEAVFPRPRIQLKLNNNRVMYFGGELGGGTWAVQRGESLRDNVTYRDLRVTWGVMSADGGSESVMEVGWAFDRSLEYRSGVGDTDLDGAFILRFHRHF